MDRLRAKLLELADALDHRRAEVTVVYMRDPQSAQVCRDAAAALAAEPIDRSEPWCSCCGHAVYLHDGKKCAVEGGCKYGCVAGALAAEPPPDTTHARTLLKAWIAEDATLPPDGRPPELRHNPLAPPLEETPPQQVLVDGRPVTRSRGWRLKRDELESALSDTGPPPPVDRLQVVPAVPVSLHPVWCVCAVCKPSL